MKDYLSNPGSGLARLVIAALLATTIPAVHGEPKKVAPARIVAPKDGLTTRQGNNVDVMVVTAEQQNVSSVVVFGDDGAALGITNQAPFLVHWNTASARPGLHTIKAQVHMKDGSTREAIAIHVMIEAAPQALAPVQTVLKESTALMLTNEEKLVSGDTPEGSVVSFRVDRDVFDPNGLLLIRAGSTAYGKAVKSSGSGMFGRAGELNLSLDSATAVDGTTVPLRAVRNAEAGDNVGGVIVGALLLSVFFVFLSGDDVEIEPGTIFTAFVGRDTVITRPVSPPTSAAANVSRSVTMLVPTSGSKVHREDKIKLSCSCTPADEAAFVRIYLDQNSLIVSQKGNLGSLIWDTQRWEKISQNGKHTLTPEVTFSTGHVVTGAPVQIELSDD